MYLPKNRSTWNEYGRGYPDVVANGHNCPVYSIGSGFIDVDGTSCSCPIFAAMVGLLNDYQTTKGRPRLGFINPLLYKMTQEATIYNPVAAGNNYCTESQCCSKEFGFSTPPLTTVWNPVTGLGQPNIKQIKTYLDKHFSKHQNN